MASWVNSSCPGGLGLGLGLGLGMSALGPGTSALGPGHLPFRFPGVQKRYLVLISD